MVSSVPNPHTPIPPWPWATLALLVVTVIVGTCQSFDQTGAISEALGFRLSPFPSLIAWNDGHVLPPLVRLFTYTFPHGGWWHLIPNTLALFVFGTMTEQRMGPMRLLAYYFASGAIGLICHRWIPPYPSGPAAGSSLAISGLLGAFAGWTTLQTVHRTRFREVLRIVAEALVTILVGLWIIRRDVPSQPDRVCALMYHFLPMLAMWLLIRWLSGGIRWPALTPRQSP